MCARGWRRGCGVSEEAQPVSEDDTHNEEYSGCVILIIPLTPPRNLMLFDSAQQQWWRSVCGCTFVCASMGLCMCEFAGKRLLESDSVCHICLDLRCAFGLCDLS